VRDNHAMAAAALWGDCAGRPGVPSHRIGMRV